MRGNCSLYGGRIGYGGIGYFRDGPFWTRERAVAGAGGASEEGAEKR